MYICSRCCTPSDKEPASVWSDRFTNKDGTPFVVKFCEKCTDRINRDPKCQFTCTDFSKEEQKYKTVSDWQKANLKLRSKK